MRFELTTDQRDLAASLESLLASADTVGAARAWADGDQAPGLKLWNRLAEQGLTMLASEATPVEVVIAFEALGRHAVPGPWVESAAYLPVALGHEVEGIATVAVPPHTPYALDADVADAVYLAGPDGIAVADIGERRASVDRTRHLFTPVVSRLAAPWIEEVAQQPSRDLAPQPAASAFDLAALATAAQLLGLGERVLADTVTYAKQRRQFGREIGSYQAIKHQLADVRIALDFARPLVHGAAVGPSPRAVSAAKVMCADAAYLASRTGLQVHGAIGYTAESDLSIWITKIRALVTAWGTPAYHRARILAALTAHAARTGA
jgi:alkylation response protein AidB-like acyl-CoA dehydrogenase